MKERTATTETLGGRPEEREPSVPDENVIRLSADEATNTHPQMRSDWGARRGTGSMASC
jgi:hypothetical protein